MAGDLKTTKEERARLRVEVDHLGLAPRAAMMLLDDLDTLEAECADLRAQTKAMTEVLADLRRLNEAEVERLRGIVREVTTTFSHDETCEAVLGHDPDEDEWDDDLCDCAAGVLRATARRALEKKP